MHRTSPCNDPGGLVGLRWVKVGSGGLRWVGLLVCWLVNYLVFTADVEDDHFEKPGFFGSSHGEAIFSNDLL